MFLLLFFPCFLCLVGWYVHTSRGSNPTSMPVPRLQSILGRDTVATESYEKSEPTKADPSELQDSFPPERRSALDGNTALAQERQTALLDPLNCIPDKSDVLEQRYENQLTPTGFTVSEIKALGSFPDYAALSGIPLPTPYRDFDIDRALPRPYRPFRWAYHQTMSLAKMENDWWLELENTYVSRLKQRQELHAKYGGLVMQTLPGAEMACKELMEMVLQFLCARYPHYFRLSPPSSPTVFHNLILANTTDLLATSPMQVLFDNVPEEFALVFRSPETGKYSFRAGNMCSSLGFNVATKIGKTIHDIHRPVPDYEEKMSFSMDRYFSKKPVDKPIQRGSWGLEIDEPLFELPGDSFDLPCKFQSPEHGLEQCNLRVDWQTLRRLPLSGAIVFNFKALFTPVANFRDEPYIPKLLLRILHDAKKPILEYKKTWHTEHIIIPALQEMIRYQEEAGLVEKDWEEHTLDESPFFPGWYEKWIEKQGFAPPA